jgi:hypothetical protein
VHLWFLQDCVFAAVSVWEQGAGGNIYTQETGSKGKLEGMAQWAALYFVHVEIFCDRSKVNEMAGYVAVMEGMENKYKLWQ